MTASKLLAGQPQWLSTESYGLLLILGSSCIYSVMGLFIQLAAKTGIPSTELVFIRAAFQGTFVVLAMLFYREEERSSLPTVTTSTSKDGALTSSNHVRRLIQVPLGDPSIIPIVLARGAVGGFGFVLYFYTISVLPLGDAVALLSLHPIATVFAAAAMLGERVRMLHIFASITTVMGSFLIARPAFIFGEQQEQDHPDNYNPFGYVTAAMGTCAGAGVFILIRKAGQAGAHTLQLLFSWVCFGLLFSVLLGLILPFGQGAWDFPSSKRAWLYTLGCCLFGSVGHFLLNFAARHSNPGLASIVRSSGIMWAYILQIFFFHQIPTLLTGVGVILVSSSLVMVSAEKYYDSKFEQEEDQSSENSTIGEDTDSSFEEQELVPTSIASSEYDDTTEMEVQPLTSG